MYGMYVLDTYYVLTNPTYVCVYIYIYMFHTNTHTHTYTHTHTHIHTFTYTYIPDGEFLHASVLTSEWPPVFFLFCLHLFVQINAELE